MRPKQGQKEAAFTRRTRKKPLDKDPRVQAFAETARAFCRIIERRSRVTKREFVHACAQAVPSIMAAFIPLLEVRTKRGSVKRSPDHLDHAEWHKLFLSIAGKVGKDNGYHEVFDPYKVEVDDPVFTSLSDDLADIYRDLNEGLVLYQQGDENSVQSAVYHWKLNMRIHASNHCASVITC